MFGQLADDQAFAFFIYYSIFPLHSPVLPYGVSCKGDKTKRIKVE